MLVSFLLFAGIFVCCATSQLPVRIFPAVLSGEVAGACPSNEALTSQRENITKEIAAILQDIVVPILNCPCGGPGQWTKIADLDFSDPSVDCPTGFNNLTTPVRGCGRPTGQGPVCLSVTFSSRSLNYSRVCGRVNAYQRGSPDAFDLSVVGRTNNNIPNPDLEAAYIDGVSLTHGAAGSRQHIWTFAAAVYETDNPVATCACTNTDVNWPYQVPTFIGNNYFCATGNPGPDFSLSTVYQDDPLWDGEGCGPTNACCEFNNPPWFCTTLPKPTTDDIELRACHDQAEGDEDTILSLVDIFIM